MGAHGLAMLGLWLAATALLWKTGGSVFLLASAVYYFQQLVSNAISAIEADDSGYRILNNDVWFPAQLIEAFITAPLTVIRFRQENNRLATVVLLSDSVAAGDYRRLRVWLRWVKYNTDLQTD